MILVKLGAVLLALALFPAAVSADGIEGKVVRVEKNKKALVIKTREGEKTLEITSDTKGLENAIQGALVKIEYSRMGNKLRASEINASKTALRV